MSATFTAMSKSLATEVVTRLEPLFEKQYHLNEKLVKALEEVPLNRPRRSCGVVPDIPPRVHISHLETRVPLISNDPQTSSHKHPTRAIPLRLVEGNRGNLKRSDGMAAGVELGWHQTSGHHQPSFSMAGGQIGDNTPI